MLLCETGVRHVLVMAAMLLPLAAAVADEKPAEATQAPLATEQAYVDRLLAMDDSAAAHVDLANWCAAHGLAEKAKVHWSEALLRDPDNAEARAALGFVNRNGQWVPVSEAEPAPIAPPADPTFAARRQALARDIEDVQQHLLVSPSAAAWTEGRNKILAIRDAAAAEPIARILGAGDVNCRLLAAEVLGQIPGDEALRYLLGLALADPADAVHRTAIESLKDRADDRIVQQLIYALARGREPTMRRAAYALGELGAMEAVPALIANLRTVEYRNVMVKELRQSPSMFVGTLTPYIAGLRPVVSGGAVAYDPIIGYIVSGGGISFAQPPQEVLVEKTQAERVEQPDVLEALKKITGRDFGYDEAEWHRWSAEREQAAPNP